MNVNSCPFKYPTVTCERHLGSVSVQFNRMRYRQAGTAVILFQPLGPHRKEKEKRAHTKY